MTLRVLQYRAYCLSPEVRHLHREQAQIELDSLVPRELHGGVTWHEDTAPEFGADAYVISWSIRMDDHEMLHPLDD